MVQSIEWRHETEYQANINVGKQIFPIRGKCDTAGRTRIPWRERYNMELRKMRLIPRVSCVLGHTIVPSYSRRTSPINILVIG